MLSHVLKMAKAYEDMWPEKSQEYREFALELKEEIEQHENIKKNIRTVTSDKVAETY